jgi:hydrogenase maturation protein HypF
MDDLVKPAVAFRCVLVGRVQGVGFRPFVFRIAHELGLTGSVRNRSGDVEVIVQGEAHAVREFVRRVLADAPPLAAPRLQSRATIAVDESRRAFTIESSAESAQARVFVPPDSFVCADCRAELAAPNNRRFAYPFINCTQCGPRYTLIERMPYDRPNTSMAEFPLCAACAAEYTAPQDRRFHAEPVACPDCGPQVWLELAGGVRQAQGRVALDRAVSLLKAGAIVAVKGIGGYHLLCDATDALAVARLRDRKRRPDKPLAVMFPLRGADGLDAVREELEPTDREAATLVDAARPIVLMRRRAAARLTSGIAPGLDEVGALLPYSPLHVLLLEGVGGPLVATSGNISGEPVQTDVTVATERLRGIADAWLHHDRRIVRPADDSVVREIAARPRAIRIGRGAGPVELTLHTTVPRPVVALGGHLKTTVALAWGDRVVISPHIGTMDSPRSLEVLAQVVGDLQSLYGVEAEQVLCDAHAGYGTSRWARELRLPISGIGHHRAHVSAVYGEAVVSGQQQEGEDMIAFAWDGVGLGDDGELWGGETFVGRPSRWRRVASFVPFAQPGGDAAAREPWRSGASMAWTIGIEAAVGPSQARATVRRAWVQGLNAPRTSAVGRLFDGFAALALGIHQTSFEGQAPMQLEAAAARFPGEPESIEVPIAAESGLRRIGWAPLVRLALSPELSRNARAAIFHASLARAAVRECEYQRELTGVRIVGLSGGVFQNRLLSERLVRELEARGFRVVLGERVPANDGGLSFGQVIEYAAGANH